MTHLLKKCLKRFRKAENGHVTVEFAIMVPILLTLLLTSVEAGVLNLRRSFLDRAMDIVVRDIRLGTGGGITHDELRTRICDEAVFFPECSSSLMLEMIALDPRAWTGIPESYTCLNRAEDGEPMTRFQHGGSNQLMVLRACVKMSPIFPTSGIGAEFEKDENGDIKITAMTAFVQEPS